VLILLLRDNTDTSSVVSRRATRARPDPAAVWRDSGETRRPGPVMERVDGENPAKRARVATGAGESDSGGSGEKAQTPAALRRLLR
jgi:hypothetical protein